MTITACWETNSVATVHVKLHTLVYTVQHKLSPNTVLHESVQTFTTTY